MGMSYRRFLAEHDSQDLARLEAFYQLEPFGPRIDDLHNGQLCAAVLAPHRGKNDPAPKPSDFMHDDRPPVSEEELMRKTLAAFGIK